MLRLKRHLLWLQNVQFVSDMEMLKESKRASDLLVESMRVELDSLREEMTDVERKAAAEQVLTFCF